MTNPADADLSADRTTDAATDHTGTADQTATTHTEPASTDDTDTVPTDTEGVTSGDDDDENDSGAETFSRSYVEKLRRENATYRERAQTAEHYAHRLHTALTEATGRLADPTDLAFDQAHLDDPDALRSAIDDLLARKPHLASRRPFGDVGQGNRGSSSEPVNLAELLRARA